MSDSTKPTQGDDGSDARSVDDQPASSPRATCDRMEPAKRMLGSEAYGDDCHAAGANGANKMPPCLLSDQQHSVVRLDRVTRVALMVTPQPDGEAIDQAWEAVSTIRVILKQQSVPMTLTKQTVFVRSTDDIEAFQKLFEAYYGNRVPATSFIVQPPCDGQALAIEAWALGGHDVDVQFPLPDVVTVAYDGLRWIYVAGISSPLSATSAYEEGEYAFRELARRLDGVGATFNDVSRIWLYQGGITETEQGDDQERIERYRELNRARTGLGFVPAMRRAKAMVVAPTVCAREWISPVSI